MEAGIGVRFGGVAGCPCATADAPDSNSTTPMRAMGTIDQHSQTQLYLGGPIDKMLTLLIQDTAGEGSLVSPQRVAGDTSLAYLEGHRMGDLLLAEADATAAALVKNGRPTRVIRIATLDEKVIGA